MINVRNADHLPHTYALYGIRHQHSTDILDQLNNNWNDNVLQLNLLKDRYFNSLRLLIFAAKY